VIPQAHGRQLDALGSYMGLRRPRARVWLWTLPWGCSDARYRAELRTSFPWLTQNVSQGARSER
jgi:hypothetical protein